MSTRRFAFIRELTPAGVVRAANFVEGFFESDDAEVISITYEKDRFVVFYSAKTGLASDGIFQAYKAEQNARALSRTHGGGFSE